jgi:hypothetical protein
MNSNNNINLNLNANLNSSFAKRVSISILNQTGHSDLSLDLEAAVELIFDKLTTEGRMAFVNNEVFSMNPESLKDTKSPAAATDREKLRALLGSIETAAVTITDALAGGSR